MSINLVLEIIFGLLIGGFISVIIYVLKEAVVKKIESLLGNDKVINLRTIAVLDTIKQILDTDDIHIYIKHKLESLELKTVLSNRIFLELNLSSLDIIKSYIKDKNISGPRRFSHSFKECFISKNNNVGDTIININIYLYKNFRIFKIPMNIRVNEKTGDFLITISAPLVELVNNKFVELDKIDISKTSTSPMIYPELENPLNNVLRLLDESVVKDGSGY